MLERVQPHTVKIYDLENKEFKVIKLKARQLLRADRFDLFAKLLYVRLRQTELEYASKIYDEHIKAFNPDLKEPGREDKNSLVDFRQTFDKLIGCFAEQDFDAEQSVIPLSEDYTLLDGAHRVAALAYYDKDVTCLHFKGVVPKAKFDYEYFRNRGLSWSTMDYIAEEMIRYLPNVHVACLWPKMVDCTNAVELLGKHFTICYQKQMKVSMESFRALIAKVYEGQPWVTDPVCVEDKSLQCYDFKGKVHLVFFTADSLKEVLTIKDEIRDIYGSGKHSLHITDNSDETREVACWTLNEDNLRDWNKASALSGFKTALQERVYYFKHVTLINIKVAIARLIRYGK